MAHFDDTVNLLLTQLYIDLIDSIDMMNSRVYKMK